MFGRGTAVVIGCATALAVAPLASAHDVAGFGQLGKGTVFTQMVAADPFAEGQPVDEAARQEALRSPGPCTEATAAGMPEGPGHDHQDAAQHRNLRCAIEQVATLSLSKELNDVGADEDVVLGEMDVKQDIAAITVTYPTAAILFFDVADPASPKFISYYEGRECDGQPIDINCGAFVDLSADGEVAYFSVQNLTSLPGQPGAPGSPGIEVIDISNLKSPTLTQAYTAAAGATGVHTARAHVIPETGGEGPRAPGEYVFANRNSVGVTIGQVVRPGGVPQIVPVSEISSSGLHDTFIQEDPLTRRTYLYLADGFNTGFKVYDVTDPSAPELLGQWDLTPKCADDWYAHTIDVAVRNGKRYVTLPVELFNGGDASDADKAEGCNPVAGSANVAGPMWIVDSTDFAKLAVPADTDDVEQQKSEALLEATWKNPAGRAGGNLTFSPHNQQIVDNKIYVSNYHGGVIVLDASKAFDGVKEQPDAERPREVGFMVPRVDEPRPIFGPLTDPLMPFFTAFPLGRPQVWDIVAYKGHILTQDMSGGFYSLRETPGSTAPSVEPGTGRGSTTGPAPTTVAKQRCSTPRGSLKRRRLGGARLGLKRAKNRGPFVSFRRRLNGRVDRFCLTDGRHIRVGYPTSALASRGGRPFAKRIAGRAIFVLSASSRYAIREVGPGDTVRRLKQQVRGLGRPYVRGANRWFLAKGSASRLVFRVRGGVVREIGIANLRLTEGRKLGRRFVSTFQ